MTHECAYSMCVHDAITKQPCDIDSPNAQWHQACAAPQCDLDHWLYGDLEPITCAWCGSPDHFPIDCPLTKPEPMECLQCVYTDTPCGLC